MPKEAMSMFVQFFNKGFVQEEHGHDIRRKVGQTGID
jgi:hypothetical protein